MYEYNNQSKESLANLCLIMDVMRDELKINALLAVPQNPPTTKALLKLKKLLRERRNTYLA